MRLIVMVKLGIAAHLIKMLLVIHRRPDNLAGVGHGTQQLESAQRNGRLVRGDLTYSLADLLKVLDQNIIGRKGIAIPGQHIECGRDVFYPFALDEAETIVPEATESHTKNTPSLRDLAPQARYLYLNF